MSFPVISRDSPVGFPAAPAPPQGGSHWRDFPGEAGPSLCDSPECFPQRHLQLAAMQGPSWGAAQTGNTKAPLPTAQIAPYLAQVLQAVLH